MTNLAPRVFFAAAMAVGTVIVLLSGGSLWALFVGVVGSLVAATEAAASIRLRRSLRS